MAVVGFIGLGVMGRSMAVNLVKAGHEVVAHDVRREAVADLAAQGAKPAASVAEAAARADIVVTMLPDTPQVEEVVLAAGGLTENPPPGRLVVVFFDAGSGGWRSSVSSGLASWAARWR